MNVSTILAPIVVTFIRESRWLALDELSFWLLNRRKILAVSTQLKQLRKESLKKFKLEHDLCGAGAALYQLSYEANWKLVIL